ncbi:MAG: branched-chain amino acid ABC transporter substrate-binding protein [Deinococcales bacterium]
MRIVVLVCFAFVVCALAQAQHTVRIAVAAPLTGTQKSTGVTIQAGAKLAVVEAQSRFRREGLTLELVSSDDQAIPQIGAGVARALVQDTNILGVIGHMNSGVSLEAMKVYAPANMPIISASNTNPTLTQKGYQSYNRVCGRDDIQGPVAAEFIRNSLKLRRVLVVNDGEAYGIGIASAFRNRARVLGLSVVGFITNPIGTLANQTISTLTQQFKLYNPEVVYYGGTEAQGGVVVRALAAAKSKAIFVGPDGLDNSGFIAIAGQAAKGVYFTSTAGPVSQLGGRDVAGFVQRYKAYFNAEPETYSPYAFDAANMMLEAILTLYKNAKKLPTRAEVARAVRELEWDGVTGRIRLDENGDRQIADYYVLQYKEAQYPGQIVKAIQSAPPAK